MNILAAYFSGTGGTALAAKNLAKALESRGVSVTLREIREGAEIGNGKEDYLVLLFPVYAFNAPIPVYRWLEELGSVNGTRAAVISISGGGNMSPNTACRRSCIRKLNDKGYNVIYDDSIVMPANVLVSTPAAAAARLLKALPVKADRIAKDIIAGIKKPLKAKLLDRALSRFCELQKKGVKRLGGTYYADDNCTGCGLCADNCPMGNISMADDKPVYSRSCCMCLKCIYGCPVNAIHLKSFRFLILKEGYDIETFEKMPVAQEKALPKGIA